MSNRRKIQPAAKPRPEYALPHLRAENNGTLTVLWPNGRPHQTVIPPDALEALVTAHNDAVLRPAEPKPRKRSWLSRLGGWR